MASEENIIKLYKIAQEKNEELIEYSSFRESLLKSIDKDKDIDQMIQKMLEASKGQHIGEYKNGLFVFSNDIIKTAEKMAYEENIRTPGTEEYERFHANEKEVDNSNISNEDSQSISEQIKNFSKMSQDERRDLLDRYESFSYEDVENLANEISGTIEEVRETGLVSGDEIEIMERGKKFAELAMKLFALEKELQEETDKEKRNELLTRIETLTSETMEECFEQLNRTDLTENERIFCLNQLSSLTSIDVADIEEILKTGITDSKIWKEYIMESLKGKIIEKNDNSYASGDIIKGQKQSNEVGSVFHTAADLGKEIIGTIAERADNILQMKHMVIDGKVIQGGDVSLGFDSILIKANNYWLDKFGSSEYLQYRTRQDDFVIDGTDVIYNSPQTQPIRQVGNGDLEHFLQGKRALNPIALHLIRKKSKDVSIFTQTANTGEDLIPDISVDALLGIKGETIVVGDDLEGDMTFEDEELDFSEESELEPEGENILETTPVVNNASGIVAEDMTVGETSQEFESLEESKSEQNAMVVDTTANKIKRSLIEFGKTIGKAVKGVFGKIASAFNGGNNSESNNTGSNGGGVTQEPKDSQIHTDVNFIPQATLNFDFLKAGNEDKKMDPTQARDGKGEDTEIVD